MSLCPCPCSSGLQPVVEFVPSCRDSGFEINAMERKLKRYTLLRAGFFSFDCFSKNLLWRTFLLDWISGAISDLLDFNVAHMSSFKAPDLS